MSWEWEPFFSSMAQVTATAFAVLLATLQLSARQWTRSKLKRAAALLALLELLVPLLASLVALMPGDPWRIGYSAMGGAGLCGLAWHAAVYRRHESEADSFDDMQMNVGLAISAVVYILLVAFSWAPQTWSLHVVASLSVWLVFSGSTKAWLLLSVRPARSADAPVLSD
jgi:hypothetical protein